MSSFAPALRDMAGSRRYTAGKFNVVFMDAHGESIRRAQWRGTVNPYFGDGN